MEAFGPGDGLLAVPLGLGAEHVLHPQGDPGAADPLGDPEGSGTVMPEGKAGPALDWRAAIKATAVLGAGGKMGSGIAWVVLKAMADLDAQDHGTPGSGRYELVLIDGDRTAFPR